MTKKTAKKQDYDRKMGHYINIYITGFFVILFGLTMIVSGINYNQNMPVGPFNTDVGLSGIGTFNNSTASPTVYYIQPYSIFLKGWYSDLTIYATPINSTLRTNDMSFTETTPLKTAITVYDISQVTLCVILFLHQFMIMFVARESALIFIDERYFSTMSEMLRRRNLHIADYIPNSQKVSEEGGEDTQGNGDKNETRISAVGNMGEDGQTQRGQIFRISYQRLESTTKEKTTKILFAIMAFLALLNFPKMLFISKFWAVIGSIVCPLIVIVIPGCFYYQVRKEMDEKGQYWKCGGIFYAVLGLILLPLFLTLSTKNMFTGPFMQS